MKKLNYLLLGAAGLLMASCANDDLQAPGSNVEGNYKVKVKLPADLGTRAVDMNTGLTANELYYAVYDAADDSYISQGQTVFTEAEGGALETEVGFNLAHGKSYKISFFAAAPKNNVYTFDGKAGTMTVNYGNMTSEGTEELDIYDCFINLLETDEIGSDDMQTSITLYRPIAQLNWGTSDLDEPAIEKAYGVDGKYILSNLSTMAYNTWDLLNNDVTGNTVKVEYKEPFTQPQDADGLPTFPVGGYDYVAMQYVLAPQDGGVYDLNLNITNDGEDNPDPSTLSADVIVNSAPVQANYQTNIYGTLLTDNVVVNVEKSPNWYKPSFNVENTADFLTAVAKGGTVTLFGDVYLTDEVSIPNNVVINLNGYDINLTTELAEGAEQIAVFYVNKGGTLEINGEGNINAPEGQYGVYVNNANSVVTINGGNFKAGYPVYVQKGKVYVNGGTFEGTTLFSGHLWALNCHDANYKNGDANIYVTGGSFLNFDPSAAPSENPPADFVTDGYKVIETTDGDNTWYTVVSDNSTVTDSFENAVQASKEGKDVYLTGNVSGAASTGGYGSNLGGLVVKGTTVNGNGYVFDVTNQSGRTNDYLIYTNGGTIENIILTCSDKSGFKGILAEGFSSDLYLNNVKVNPDANVAYAFNFSVGNNKTVNAYGSTFCGWCSWGTGFKVLNFNNCYFGIGTYYSGSSALFNGLVKPYSTTVFENCQFNEMIYMDLSELASDATVTFKNCTVNGVVLTEANHTIMKGYTYDSSLSDWENYENVKSRIIFN